MLAGLSNELASTGNACEACVKINTGAGKELILRAITYGVANAAGDIDVSQAAFNVLHQNEYPRAMTWTLRHLPGLGPAVLPVPGAGEPGLDPPVGAQPRTSPSTRWR